MSRKIAGRLVLTGQLIAETALHVGAIGESPDSDMPLARDGADRYYLPGSSLAGVCRAWLAGSFDVEQMYKVWGDKPRNDDDGAASWLFVEDAPATQDTILPEIRDGVGIDRVLGVAADKVKYDRVVLPVGTRFTFRLIADLPSDLAEAATVRHMVVALNQALQAGAIGIGAAASRGLGAVKLLDAVLTYEDFASRAGMLATLRHRAGLKGAGPSTPPTTDDEAEPETRAAPWLELSVSWQPLGPVMVKADQEGETVKIVPLLTADAEGHLRPVLPGSGTKGVLRSQAERILRTILGDDALDITLGEDRETEHLQQVKLPRGGELIDFLFGSAADHKGQQAGLRPGMSALSVLDCHAEQQIDAPKWRAALDETDEIRAKDRFASVWHGDARGAVLLPTMHVAIDRWTGGAADKFLFSTLEPHGLRWQPLRLRLNLSRLADTLKLPALALLLLVLDDLARGRIALGYGGNRGLGAVQVTDITCSGHMAGLPLPQEGLTLNPNGSAGLLAALPPALRTELAAAWQAWLLTKGGTP